MAEIHSVNKGLWRSFTSFNLSFYQRDLELLMLLNVMCEFWINLKPQYSQVTLAYFKAPAHPQSAHTGVFFSLLLPDYPSSQDRVGMSKLCSEARTTNTSIILTNT